MTDIHSKEVRSYNMSRIRGKDTKPELLVRKFLFANGFRYRLHDKKLPGKPDIVLKKYKTVIFVHGCFWHGHEGCRYAKIPNTNRDFWQKKIENNRSRDSVNQRELTMQGWRIFTIWECELLSKSLSSLKNLIEMILNKN